MKKKTVEQLFPGSTDLIMQGKCPTCKKPITKFRNEISSREFTICGMCQECQDSVFGKD